MTNEINTILRYFFANSDLAGISEDDLRDLSMRYPFSSIAQFLLTKKLLQLNSASAKEQATRTNLYFHNPLWFEYILNPDAWKKSGSIKEENPVYHVATPPIETPTEEKAVSEAASTQHDHHELPHPVADEAVATGMEANETDSDVSGQTSGESGYISSPQEEKAEETTGDTKAVKETAFQPDNSYHQEDTLSDDDAETENEQLAFEPYHTVDYFASQGIRLKQSELRNDRLGQQLKSFTEWLRSMKRLPNSAPVEGVDELAQQSVVLSAQHSIEDREVVTETMAEVWLKQGNIKKALDTYAKLSLQNPAKSAYFAAKIDEIKLM